MDSAELVPSVPALAGTAAWVPGLRLLAHGGGAASALVVLLALVVLFRQRREPSLVWAGAVFGFVLVLALLANLLLLATAWPGDQRTHVAVGLFAGAVAFGVAALVWPRLRRLLAPPMATMSDPGDAGHRDVVRRIEQALADAEVTVFTQDGGLRFSSLLNPRPGLTPTGSGTGMAGAEPLAALAIKREALATGRSRAGVVSVVLPDGVHHFDLTVSPTHRADGSVDGLLGAAVDVTERRQFDVRLAAVAAQAAAAYRRFDLALEGSPITVFEQDSDLRYTFMHNPPPGTAPEAFIGRTDADLYGAHDLATLTSLKRGVIERGERASAELELDVAGVRRFYALRLDPKTGESGEAEGVIGTAVDLTERRRHEQNIKLVMRELTHRSKNLLAVVQAMARKTASTAPDTDSFIRDFSSRLRAIAAAHDLLVAESWSGAGLRELLTVSLSQTVDVEAPAVRIEGPDLKLAPDAAQMLALAFHELSMNAVRHGALSSPGGRISVRWREDGESINLCWREEGGPEVTPPGRSGFGRVLLERLVGASLGGSVDLQFPAEGLVCTLTFQKDRLIPAQ